jgi:hypothetical protein
MKLTVDTGLLIQLIDNKLGADDVRKIFDLHEKGAVQLYVSNRIFEHDTTKMSEPQLAQIKDLIQHAKVIVDGAVFRSGFSLLSGGDLLSGGVSHRSQKELEKFGKLVGKDPVGEYLASSTISNKLGDYDALRDHFTSGRNIFLTADEKHYFATAQRQKYRKELGLIIQSPAEFLDEFGNLQDAQKV